MATARWPAVQGRSAARPDAAAAVAVDELVDHGRQQVNVWITGSEIACLS